MDTIYLLPGEERCVDFRDANGVPKVHYTYCSIRGRLLFTDMSEFQDGATYTQIKDYVLEHSGLKVSNLYISQIKRKCGIEVGKNYNLPKSEDSRQPQCPPEKEKAIREAFKYFGMI